MTAEAIDEDDAATAPYQRRPYRRDRERRRRRRRSRSRKPAKECSKSDGSGAEESFEFQPHHAKSVPRDVNFDEAFDMGNQESITTVMLRNIPCKYMQGNLLREIDQMGFEGTYDFFYLPLDTRNKTSVGYAFVNFLDEKDAERFTTTFTGYRFQRHQNEKIAEVSPAKIQGLRNNVMHFANSAVVNARNSKCRPIVLQSGIKRDFGDLVAELHAEQLPALIPQAQTFGFASLMEKQTGTVFSHLNAHAEEFVPCGAPPGLNPMAQEFVPSGMLQCEKPVVIAEAKDPDVISSAMDVTVAVSVPVLEDQVFKEARTDLEATVRRLLQQSVVPEGISKVSTPHTASTTTLAVADTQQLSSRCFGAEEPSVVDATGSSWIAQAFEVLVDDLALLPSIGQQSNTSGGYVAEAFQLLIDEVTLKPIQADCWVAEAFTNLVCVAIGGTPSSADTSKWTKSSIVRPAPASGIMALRNGIGESANGGGWINEAFRALTSASSPKSRQSSVSIGQEGGWIAEAFRALSTSTNKRSSEKHHAEEMFASSGKSTPRNMTPRLGDSLQRLQALGGWAWVAFA